MLDIYLPVLMSIIFLNSNWFGSKPIYNQAYQENFAADSIVDIRDNAQNAYVLLDIFGTGVVKDIDTIKSHGNQIGGYISAGTGEKYRDDFSDLEPYLTSTAWPEWPDEFFVSETTTGILPIMKHRIDKMAAVGIDWVEFDNMDWLNDETRVKYNLTATIAQAKTYINALCDYTHSKGMKCMAKNTVDSFEHFDGVLYESYHNEKNWWDVEGTQSFLTVGKPVIINHYNETDCDGVYEEYKSIYKSDNISFICEDRNLKKYKHYNE
jgi:endo-alpha-1,4-polygalactosaminidase (GH114 family)